MEHTVFGQRVSDVAKTLESICKEFAPGSGNRIWGLER